MPTDNTDIGRTARDVEPHIRQAMIARGDKTPRDLFEWKLYVIRKQVGVGVAAQDLTQKGYFYINTLSSRVICYKGLLLADQVERYYKDLADERMESALALCIGAIARIHFPPGILLILSALLLTTAKSIRSAATSIGCASRKHVGQ